MITVETLKAKKACQGQVDLFQEYFPKGVVVTVEAAKSVADKFDWIWAAENLLSKEGYEAYREGAAPFKKAYWKGVATLEKAYREGKAPLEKAYREGVAPLRQAYLEGVDTLEKAYREGEAIFWKAYQEGKAPIYKVYQEGRAPLWQAYREGEAGTFARIYIEENSKKEVKVEFS